MKILLIKTMIICCITNLVAQVEPDPNAEAFAAGVSEDALSLLCHAATGNAEVFNKDWRNVIPTTELIYMLEDIDFGAVSKPEDLEKREEFRRAMVQKWIGKYSKCFCELEDTIYGPLAAMMIYTRNTEFISRYYDPKNSYDIDVNEIIWVDFYNNKKGTLLDYVYFVRDESNNHTVEQSNDFWRYLTNWEKKLIQWGAKRMNEL